MAYAHGIDLAQAFRTSQPDDGNGTKRLQPGVAAGGVLAAQLSARGFHGPHQALWGRFGLYRVYLREVDSAPVLQEPGRRFEVERTGL